MAEIFLWDHVIHSPLSNAASLAAIDVTGYVNGVVANVVGVGVFTYNNSSSATADNLTVIQPTTGTGRWLITPVNIGSANSILGTTGAAGETSVIPFTALARTLSAETTASGFRSDISAASSGANSDITSLSGLTTALSVPQGGTGATSLTGVVIGNAGSAFTTVTAPSGSIVGTTDTQTLTNKTISFASNTLTGVASSGANSNITSLSGLTTPLSAGQGGTGVNSLGTGVATFLQTPSSANLAACVTSETGTGALVFASGPTISGPTLSGTITASGLTASQVVLTDASNRLSSYAYSETATASTFPLRDANVNLFARNFIGTYGTTVTSGGTTVLAVSSGSYRYFTGTSNQTVTLPVTSSLATGFMFTIVNLSSGILSVQSSGGDVVETLAPKTMAWVQCILASGITDASWNSAFLPLTRIGAGGSMVLSESPTFDTKLTSPTAVFTGASNINNDYTANSGSSLTIDAGNGYSQAITLTANTTLTLQSSPTTGTEEEITLDLIQDATGSRTVAWSNVSWNNGVDPTVSTTASSVTRITLKGTVRGWIGYANVATTDPVTFGQVNVGSAGSTTAITTQTQTSGAGYSSYISTVNTTDATVTTIYTITLPTDTTYSIRGMVRARRTGGTAGTAGDSAGFQFFGTVKTITSTASIVSTVDIVSKEDQAGWDLTFSPTGATILIRVTGAVNNNITWDLFLEQFGR